MSNRRLLPPLLFSLLLLLAQGLGPALAQQPANAPSPIATSVPDSIATQVFVLGTPHLSELADRFEPSMVDSLVSALDAFGPDAVAIEKIPGRQIAAMERWGGRHNLVNARFADPYLHHGHLLQNQMGWTWSEANQRADSLLSVVRADPDAVSPDTRMALVRSLTAAYRFPSAVLQWQYLHEDTGSAETTLPDTTARALDAGLDAANETYSIGMRLAHRRGHQRLYPIDHQAEKDRAVSIFPPLMKAIGDSMRAALDADPVLSRADSLENAGLENGSLLQMYRYLNTDVVARADVNIQWRSMLDAGLPDQIGRQWLVLWESRNLHMVGHIRRVTSLHPGGRVLVIVGSSHKPFFDAYLRQMMGIHVVDPHTVLGRSQVRATPSDR